MLVVESYLLFKDIDLVCITEGYPSDIVEYENLVRSLPVSKDPTEGTYIIFTDTPYIRVTDINGGELTLSTVILQLKERSTQAFLDSNLEGFSALTMLIKVLEGYEPFTVLKP